MMCWLVSITKENPAIAAGKLFLSLCEFRMCFKLMQSRRILMPRLSGLIKGSYMLDGEVLMGAPILVNGTFLLDGNQMEVPLELIKSLLNTLVLLVHREYQQ
jgi:hypothetical protein